VRPAGPCIGAAAPCGRSAAHRSRPAAPGLMTTLYDGFRLRPAAGRTVAPRQTAAARHQPAENPPFQTRTPCAGRTAAPPAARAAGLGPRCWRAPPVPARRRRRRRPGRRRARRPAGRAGAAPRPPQPPPSPPGASHRPGATRQISEHARARFNPLGAPRLACTPQALGSLGPSGKFER